MATLMYLDCTWSDNNMKIMVIAITLLIKTFHNFGFLG